MLIQRNFLPALQAKKPSQKTEGASENRREVIRGSAKVSWAFATVVAVLSVTILLIMQGGILEQKFFDDTWQDCATEISFCSAIKNGERR